MHYIYIGLLILTVLDSRGQQRIAFTHVNIIDPATRKIIKDQSLYIENWIIQSMGRQVSIPGGTQTIDGSGKFLLPGLAEMHAHIPVPDSSGNTEQIKQTLTLFLANGVTTIRGMLGQPYHLQIQKEMIRLGIPSPKIYTSSPSFNGNSVPDEATAERLVRQYKNDGYHFLKIHPGIKRNVYDVLAKTAKETGIPFAGHVPVEVGILHAVRSGQITVDHLDGMIDALAPPLPDLNQNGFFGFNVTDQINLLKIKGLVTTIKKTGAWMVPTQTLITRWFSPEDPKTMINTKEIMYMPSRTRYAWLQSKTNLIASQGYTTARFTKFLDTRKKLLLELYKQDVPLLMGSDAPQVMNVPGFSIHYEMQTWADAGIPNWEILRAATCNVSTFFKTSHETGSIAVGKQANLVLLSSDPTKNIGNSRSIEGVIAMGVPWMAKQDIEKALERIAKANE